MTGNVEEVSTLDDFVQTNVTLDNHDKVIVLGKGTVDIVTLKGKQCVIPKCVLCY